MADHVSRTGSILLDSRHRQARSFQIRRITCKPSQAGVRTCNRRSNGLPDFMCQRCRQLSHHTHTVNVREISLYLAQSFPLLFSALALRDVNVGSHQFNQLTARTETGWADAMNVLDCSVGKPDLELVFEIFSPSHIRPPFFAHSAPTLASTPFTTTFNSR